MTCETEAEAEKNTPNRAYESKEMGCMTFREEKDHQMNLA